MHVRRGDKVNEARPIEFGCYMAVAERYRVDHNARDIWLLTDDQALLEAAPRLYPAFNFLHNAHVGNRFSSQKDPTAAAIEVRPRMIVQYQTHRALVRATCRCRCVFAMC